jgi:hypothetical protein
MEALKLAFETVIIGLFALPWLWVMIDLANPNLFSPTGISRLMTFIPKELRATAIGLTLFSLVYLLGSMVAPVASEFLNDPDMLGGLLPTEEKIQAWTYTQMGAPIPGLTVPAKVEPANFPLDVRSEKAYEDEGFRHAVHKEFGRQESTLLLRGPDACERLNRLHEQLTVLRGATFSAFALMALCGFAWCGRPSKNPNLFGALSAWQQLRRSVAFAISVGFIVVAAKELVDDLHHPEAGDMPIAELVFLVLGGFGLYVAICGTRSRLQFHGLTSAVALCFALLCYAGYGCTETSYDQAVFNSYEALLQTGSGNSPHPVAPTVLTTPIAY